MSEHAHAPHPPGDGLDHGTRGKLGALETIKELTPQFAEAKAQRAYLEHHRKSLKALLMIEAEQDKGIKTGTLQERYAYAHQNYQDFLKGLRAAIELEEKLSLQIVAARAAISMWQTRMASDRIERQTIR
jgi:hypothetical protein